MTDARYARLMALDKKQAALEARRFAHFLRRGGLIGSFKDWMHDAQRNWRSFRYWNERARS